ncbi:hypothetical protein GCM10010140_76370 [Streptosporangium pseudovulgare]|uniref:Uncharacterized protein n=1 Tax=Streptosporangium pseudovulgare TaxID=35765 RepID=A0ABQ2RJ57_9ACTN|nr:hypothetical protein GCM10010140_76370 [Streptosporangium pseudovulgare]
MSHLRVAADASGVTPTVAAPTAAASASTAVPLVFLMPPVFDVPRGSASCFRPDPLLLEDHTILGTY